MANWWVVRLDERHKAAFEEMARTSRRTPADEVRYYLDRALAARALKAAGQKAAGQKASTEPNTST
jgi:hypothetical protein